MKRRSTAMLLVLSMLFVLAACGGTTPAATTTAAAATTAAPTTAAPTGKFLIGTYLQLTGSNSIVGNAGKQGIDLAVKYINDNGGFNGSTVEVLHYDTTGSTEEAVKVVQRMLESDAVDAVIGSINSNEVTAVIPYLNEAQI